MFVQVWRTFHDYWTGSGREGLTSFPVLSGPEDTVGPEEDGSVLGHLGLCKAYLKEGGCGCFLQGLRPQHVGNHPLRWYWPGCLWGRGVWVCVGSSFSWIFLAQSDSLLSSHRLWRIRGSSASPQTVLIQECLCSWPVAPLPAHVVSWPAIHLLWSGLECRPKVSHCSTVPLLSNKRAWRNFDFLQRPSSYGCYRKSVYWMIGPHARTFFLL